MPIRESIFLVLQMIMVIKQVNKERTFLNSDWTNVAYSAHVIGEGMNAL